ncbi:unnamed protein product, partial [Cuscuta europaea]
MFLKHGLTIGIRADREPIRRTPAEYYVFVYVVLTVDFCSVIL